MTRATQSRHPVVLFSNGIGDALLFRPCLEALATMAPGRVTLVTRAGRYPSVFDELPLKDVLVIQTGQRRHWDHEESERLARRIGPCDLFMGAVPWDSESLRGFCRRLAPESSVGFFPWYDVVVPFNTDKHTADLSFDLVRQIAPDLRLLDFYRSPRYSARAQAFVADVRACLQEGTKLLVVHADTMPEKMWPDERFGLVIEQALAGPLGNYVAVVVGWEWPGEELARLFTLGRVLPFLRLPIEEALLLCARADLFLGVDSCMLHAADLAGVPSVGLFGPTQAAEFGCLKAPSVCLQAGQTMREIQASDVLNAIEYVSAGAPGQHVWRVSADVPHPA